ncbi:MAG: M15 family metallopeptidase [Actinobacteria bacterium]|nr:M15 family metallopeptidase [Actinomycetota bacterium]
MRRAQGPVLAPLVVAALAACSSSATPDGMEPIETLTRSPTPVVEAAPSDEGSAEEEPAPGRERSGFHGKIDALPPALAAEMRGTTWKPGCPVPLDDMRVLHFNFWGLNGAIKRGPMVVNASVADDVLWVFHQLFEARFPLKRVGLTREFVPSKFEPIISSTRSVTASFNCRPVITPLGPGDDFSQHAYGLAVDVNPVQNPFVTADGFVRNTEARPYVDRSKDLPGMIHAGDVVVRSFAAIGWEWGGFWSGGKDYMHFSLLGR